MYAIVDVAGQQFKVEKGNEIFVNRLEIKEGENLAIDKVLLIDNDGKIILGQPLVKGALVTAKVIGHPRGDKVMVFKKKRRKGFRVKNGYRKDLTRLLIEEIEEKASPKKAASAKSEPSKPAAPKAAVKKPKEATPAAEAMATKDESKKATASKTTAKATTTKKTTAAKKTAGTKKAGATATARKASAKSASPAKKPVTKASVAIKKPAAKASASAKKPTAKKAPAKGVAKKDDK